MGMTEILFKYLTMDELREYRIEVAEQSFFTDEGRSWQEFELECIDEEISRRTKGE